MEIRELKDAAKVAAAYLNRDGIDIQQSKMLEAFGRAFVGRNWAVLRAKLEVEGLTVADAERDPASALSETIGGLLNELDAQTPTASREHSPGYAIKSYKSQGRDWLSILEGLKQDDAPATPTPQLTRRGHLIGAGLDFSGVEPSDFTLIAVLENEREVEGEVRVDYATGQMRFVGSIDTFKGRKAKTFYLETIHGFDTETRHLLKNEGMGNFCFARNQDFCRFQKAYDWLIGAAEPAKTPKQVPAKITGKIFVRCQDKTESEIPAVLNTVSQQVELLTTAPGADPLPEGPYEKEWFLVGHEGAEHDYPAWVDGDGDWFVSEYHIQAIKRLLSE